MSDVSHVDQQIRGRHFLKRGPEGGDQLGWEVRHESDRVGEDCLVEPRQLYVAHRRIEGRKEKVFREHRFAGQAIEKRGFSSVRVADQSNHRPWRPLPPAAMQAPRPLNLVELAADLRHPLSDQAPVSLDLRFARTSEEAEATTLALEMGPASDQTTGLIVEMGKLDLQAALGCRCPLAEDLQDETRSIDHLGANFVFQVLLLDRSKRRIDDQQPGAAVFRKPRDLLDLALSEERCRADRPDAQGTSGDHVDADSPGKAFRFLYARFCRAARTFAGKLGHRDNRPLSTSDLDRTVSIKAVQDLSSSPSCSPPRSSGCAGCKVEIACL